jgi:hypothetical protein
MEFVALSFVYCVSNTPQDGRPESADGYFKRKHTETYTQTKSAFFRNVTPSRRLPANILSVNGFPVSFYFWHKFKLSECLQTNSSTRLSGLDSQRGAEIFLFCRRVLTSSDVHSASYPMKTVGKLTRGGGGWNFHTPVFIAEVRMWGASRILSHASSWHGT